MTWHPATERPKDEMPKLIKIPYTTEAMAGKYHYTMLWYGLHETGYKAWFDDEDALVRIPDNSYWLDPQEIDAVKVCTAFVERIKQVMKDDPATDHMDYRFLETYIDQALAELREREGKG